MKKYINFVMIICICLVFVVGCGTKKKNEYIVNVETLISEIGEVDGSSGSKIQVAREKYDMRTEEDKKEVENYYTLAEAESLYNDIVVKQEEEKKKKELENAKSNIDAAFAKIKDAKNNYDDMVLVVYSKWNSVGFDCLFVDKDMSVYTQEYKDTVKEFKKKKSESESNLSSASSLLNGISSVPDEYKGYYDSVKEAYSLVKTYGTLTDYPEGYSKLTYSQTYTTYKNDAESAINAAEIKK